MPGFRPRIGVVGSGQGLRAALAALAGDLAEGPLDLVLLAPRSAGAPLPARQVHEASELRDALEAARAAGAGTVLLELAAGSDPLAEGRRLAAEGRLDALLVPAEPSGGPRLRIRDGIRVVEAFPGLAARELLERLAAGPLVSAGTAAAALLRRLGLARPRLLLLDLAGERAPDEAARALRSAGLDLVGPLPAASAAQERADAVLVTGPDQAELLLALLGRGLETRFPLDGASRVVEAWPARSEEAALVLAAARLGEACRHGGPLAAEREAERAPALSIVSRAPRPKQDRCPYCHRALDDPPGDDTGDPPGPPATCVACRTAHHRDCLAEHGRCTVLGCKGVEVERLGVRLALARLGPSLPRREPFRPLTGDAGAGPAWLRVEAPHDDPDRSPRVRSISLEVLSAELHPGEVLMGHVVVHAPRPFRIRGGVVRIRAELTTREPPDPERVQPILHREAPLVGEAPSGRLGKLQDGMASLFGGAATGVAIPQGVRRWPFALRLHAEHPPTVENRIGRTSESVSTLLEVVLDTDTVTLPITVRR